MLNRHRRKSSYKATSTKNKKNPMIPLSLFKMTTYSIPRHSKKAQGELHPCIRRPSPMRELGFEIPSQAVGTCRKSCAVHILATYIRFLDVNTESQKCCAFVHSRGRVGVSRRQLPVDAVQVSQRCMWHMARPLFVLKKPYMLSLKPFTQSPGHPRGKVPLLDPEA